MYIRRSYTFPLAPTKLPLDNKSDAHAEWVKKANSDDPCPLCKGLPGHHGTEPMSPAHILYAVSTPRCSRNAPVCPTPCPCSWGARLHSSLLHATSTTAALTRMWMRRSAGWPRISASGTGKLQPQSLPSVRTGTLHCTASYLPPRGTLLTSLRHPRAPHVSSRLSLERSLTPQACATGYFALLQTFGPALHTAALTP